MRFLGIDYGTKRVGLALSDETGRIATPYSVVANTSKLAAEIAETASANGAEEVVIGESKDYDMKDNEIMEGARKLGVGLKSAGFGVHFEPEFMTSIQAERLQGKHDKIDASAAALILQSFLDKQADQTK